MGIVRYTVIDSDNEIVSAEQPHGNSHIGRWLSHTPKVIVENNEKYVFLVDSNGKKSKYHVTGPWNTFRYRLKRSLKMAEHIGLQKVWLAGEVEPYQFKRDKIDPLRTAQVLHDATEYAPIEMMIRPRKHDWLIVALVGLVFLFVGFGIGRSI